MVFSRLMAVTKPWSESGAIILSHVSYGHVGEGVGRGLDGDALAGCGPPKGATRLLGELGL
jgi:hypothetical protein